MIRWRLLTCSRRTPEMATRIICGDALATLCTLASNSVHAVVTSPPYFALRDYQTGRWEGGDAACDHANGRQGATRRDVSPERLAERAALYGTGTGNGSAVPPQQFRNVCGKCGAVRIDQQIGLEPTVAEYIAALVGVFRECKRVLRSDGNCFVNLGDSYNNFRTQMGPGQAFHGRDDLRGKKEPLSGGRGVKGIGEKSLMLIPQRIAIALSDDGWIIRSIMVWLKRSCLPESVTDRATNATEYVIHAVRSPRYFWDAQAVQRGVTTVPQNWTNRGGTKLPSGDPLVRGAWSKESVTSRNFRNTDLFFDSLSPPYGAITDRDGTLLALDVNPEPLALGHFAAYPTKLVSPLIRASTSERGCCAACGVQWVRETEKQFRPTQDPRSLKAGTKGLYDPDGWDVPRGRIDTRTLGWTASCRCPPSDPVPATVLDLFSGAGTTCLVASRMGRDAIGIELSAKYVAMSRARLEADAGFFSDIVDDPAPADDPLAIADLFAADVEGAVP
jgi:DNA modification methylase